MTPDRSLIPASAREFRRPPKAATEEVLLDRGLFAWRSVLPVVTTEFDDGKTLAIANGNFALMHPGHSLLLEGSRLAGAASRSDRDPEAVVVLAIVNNDAQTHAKDPIKGAVATAFERAAMVYDSRHSDIVVISESQDRTMLHDFQTLVNAGVRGRRLLNVKGDDYKFNRPAEADLVEASGGQMIILPRFGFSTSNKITAVYEHIRGQLLQE